jgi:hypothetical protein
MHIIEKLERLREAQLEHGDNLSIMFSLQQYAAKALVLAELECEKETTKDACEQKEMCTWSLNRSWWLFGKSSCVGKKSLHKGYAHLPVQEKIKLMDKKLTLLRSKRSLTEEESEDLEYLEGYLEQIEVYRIEIETETGIIKHLQDKMRTQNGLLKQCRVDMKERGSQICTHAQYKVLQDEHVELSRQYISRLETWKDKIRRWAPTILMFIAGIAAVLTISHASSTMLASAGDFTKQLAGLAEATNKLASTGLDYTKTQATIAAATASAGFGATIGTFLFPGMGTAIGGAVGGLAGGAAGLYTTIACDRNLKENIVRISRTKKRGLHVYIYRYKNTLQEDIGLIAQHVQKIYPTAVKQYKGFLYLDYCILFDLITK